MLAVLPLFPVLLVAAGQSQPYEPPELGELAERIQSTAAEDVGTRLVKLTEPFVGAPYAKSPLGEGEGPDPDPRLRLDAFDCTTFVETSIAMSVAEDTGELQDVLDLIRYRAGEPSFNNRRHFPEAEWIPDLVALGLLEDITVQVAGTEAEVAQKRLDLASWDKRRHKILHELDRDRIPVGEFPLPVWPIAAAKKGYKRIPPGTVLSVVRSNRTRVPVRVSHQGLVVEKGGKLFLRHAASKVYGRVVDEPLSWFLARNAKYKKWPVTGIHLAQVKSPDANWRTVARTLVEPPPGPRAGSPATGDAPSR